MGPAHSSCAVSRRAALSFGAAACLGALPAFAEGEEAPAVVAQYELFTARDVPSGKRDPVSWSFGLLHASGEYEVLS